MHHHRLSRFSPAPLLIAALAVAPVSFALPAPAPPALETYKIDLEHTNIGFRVSHLMFTKVPGRFNKFEGTLTLDRSDLSKGSVTLTIDAAGIDTNEPARDRHLKSDAFFDVEKFPKITFQSRRVKQVGQNKLQVEGDLTIRDVTKPVTLDVDVLGFGSDGYGAYRAAFEAHTKINRQDFGVSWNDVLEGGGLMVGNEVDINLSIEAIRQKAARPGAKNGR